MISKIYKTAVLHFQHLYGKNTTNSTNCGETRFPAIFIEKAKTLSMFIIKFSNHRYKNPDKSGLFSNRSGRSDPVEFSSEFSLENPDLSGSIL